VLGADPLEHGRRVEPERGEPLREQLHQHLRLGAALDPDRRHAVDLLEARADPVGQHLAERDLVGT
jgi:hypothetical protein